MGCCRSGKLSLRNVMRFYRCFYVIYFYYMLGFVKLDDSDVLGIRKDSCRFELHTSSVTWEKAYQICKNRGLTLASLTASTEGQEMASFVHKAHSAFSQISSTSISSFWIGLRMESTSGGTSEFHWGDCVTTLAITDSFEKLTSYTEATACGCFRQESVRLTRCDNTVKMGFMCENPNGVDSCFSTMSTTIHALGYSGKTALTSSDCASICLMSALCGAIYLSSGDSCTMMYYSSGLTSTLSASLLASTYYYHKRFIYMGPYLFVALSTGLSEDDLCNLPVESPIVTTVLNDFTTTEFITPTTTKEVTTQPTPEETTTDVVTTPSTQDKPVTDYVTTQLPPEETTTDDVTTQSTQDKTASDDVTTQPTPEETTTDDVTTLSTQVETATDDATPQLTPEGTTSDDVTSQISHVSTTIPQVTIYNFSFCSCVCVEKNDTLEEKNEKIVSELKVDTSILSSTVRQKTCAEDPRPSVKNIGMMGVAILALIIGLIISFDIIRFLQYLNEQVKNG